MHLLRLTPDEEARGVIALDDKEYVRARELLGEALELRPDDRRAYFALKRVEHL